MLVPKKGLELPISGTAFRLNEIPLSTAYNKLGSFSTRSTLSSSSLLWSGVPDIRDTTKWLQRRFLDTIST